MSKKTIRSYISIIGLLISLVLIYQGFSKPQVNSQSQIVASPAVEAISIASTSATLPSQIPAGFTAAQVMKVVDGDTIEVLIGGQPFKIRFIGIDTPETVDPRRPVGCFGKEASDANKQLLQGKTIYLEKDISETDKYSRLLRYIYLPQPDGNLIFVNDYLVRQGFAKSSTYPPDVKYQDRFIQAQEEARVGNRGLWDKCK